MRFSPETACPITSRCNTSSASSPWRVGLAALQRLPNGQQQVNLTLYLDTAASSATVGMNKLEIDVRTLSIAQMYRGTFKNVYVNGRRITSVIWESNRPIVKFTNLGLTQADVAARGAINFSFTSTVTTLDVVCGGSTCLASAFDNNGVTGACPLSSVALRT